MFLLLLNSDRAVGFLHHDLGYVEECNMVRGTANIVHDYHLVTMSANQSSKRRLHFDASIIKELNYKRNLNWWYESIFVPCKTFNCRPYIDININRMVAQIPHTS